MGGGSFAGGEDTGIDMASLGAGGGGDAGGSIDWKSMAGKMAKAGAAMQGGKQAAGNLLDAGQMPSVPRGGMMPTQDLSRGGTAIDEGALVALIKLIQKGR